MKHASDRTEHEGKDAKDAGFEVGQTVGWRDDTFECDWRGDVKRIDGSLLILHDLHYRRSRGRRWMKQETTLAMDHRHVDLVVSGTSGTSSTTANTEDRP